jgi:AbrB family looped-hinge helix DNA binding protein
MRITTKGQVTIPIEIRKKFGFLPDSEVDFVVDGNSVRLVKSASSEAPGRGDAALRALGGRATVRMSTDDIMALTRRQPAGKSGR